MRSIDKPFVAVNDPDRNVRCQDAIQFALADLIEAARTAGWSERETLEAVAALVEYRLSEIPANIDTAALRALLKSMM